MAVSISIIIFIFQFELCSRFIGFSQSSNRKSLFIGILRTLHAQINASRLIILTREPSMHAGSKPEHGEEEKKKPRRPKHRKTKGYMERPCQHSTENLRAVRQ